MDVSRAEKIAEILKTTKQLTKNVGKPATAKAGQAQAQAPALLQAAPEGPAALPPPVAGTDFLRVLMYVVAGLLIVGLILLAVDQWITPVFQRTPGGQGFIPIPGNDSTQVYWATLKDIADITVGAPPLTSTKALSTTVIEGQTNYSITMDVYVKDEFAQDLAATDNDKQRRIFFALGSTVASPALIAWISNDANTAYVTSFDSNGLEETVEFENIPIHTPFRIGIVKTPYAMEGYLNGLLVKTRQIKSANILPSTGFKIFSPANIVVNGTTLSKNILVLNVRTFGYTAASSEMQGRMSDLKLETDFIPPKVSYK